jgi:hypothetical protein
MQEKRKRRPGGGRKPKPGEKRKLVTVRMLPSLKRQLEQAAQANKRSFTAELEFRAAKPAQATPLRPAHIIALGDVVMMLATLIENPAPAPEGEQYAHAGAGSWLTPKGGIALRAALDPVLRYISPEPEGPLPATEGTGVGRLTPEQEAQDIGIGEAIKLTDALKLLKRVTPARSSFEALQGFLQGFLSFQNRR